MSTRGKRTWYDPFGLVPDSACQRWLIHSPDDIRRHERTLTQQQRTLSYVLGAVAVGLWIGRTIFGKEYGFLDAAGENPRLGPQDHILLALMGILFLVYMVSSRFGNAALSYAIRSYEDSLRSLPEDERNTKLQEFFDALCGR